MVDQEYNNHWYKQEKAGWYEWTITRHHTDASAWINFYVGIVGWIYCHVDGYCKHARWILNPETAVFRFRYERDFLQFILKWS